MGLDDLIVIILDSVIIDEKMVAFANVLYSIDLASLAINLVTIFCPWEKQRGLAL
jgi:hypothetical protein